jgi:hypothetical protein
LAARRGRVARSAIFAPPEDQPATRLRRGIVQGC